MPYIRPDVRNELDPKSSHFARGPGELNYQITRLLLDYLAVHGSVYQTHNDILGALEGAKLEWYRRMTGEYEDTKRRENGDVYVAEGDATGVP